MIFLHIGAGAGDKDPRANFRDGFSEFVKQNRDKNKKIYLVEANPKNIKTLKKSWIRYKNVKIFNCAIIPKKIKKKTIKLYYVDKDFPHYQVMSADIKHVRKHYPDEKIKSINIKALKINDFFRENFNKKEIESFSLDIEGLDFDVLMDLDLERYKINNISFEYLHLDKFQKIKLINKLINSGYSYNGYGIDHNNFDLLFSKEKKIFNNFLAKILPFISHKHLPILNKLIIKF